MYTPNRQASGAATFDRLRDCLHDATLKEAAGMPYGGRGFAQPSRPFFPDDAPGKDVALAQPDDSMPTISNVEKCVTWLSSQDAGEYGAALSTMQGAMASILPFFRVKSGEATRECEI